jgi:hypothetical protein
VLNLHRNYPNQMQYQLGQEMAVLRQEIAELQSGMKQILSILEPPTQKMSPTEPLKKYTYSTEDMATAQFVLNTVLTTLPKTTVQKSTLPSWANTIRLMTEVDKRTHAQIENLMTAVSHDHFWSGNILSPQKLRKHWGRLQSLTVEQNYGEPLDKYRKQK